MIDPTSNPVSLEEYLKLDAASPESSNIAAATSLLKPFHQVITSG